VLALLGPAVAAGNFALAQPSANTGSAAGSAAIGASTTQANAAGPQAADEGGEALQEVVVTAERRATDLQATPIALTAISGEELTGEHVNDLNDLQLVVPSLQSFDQGGVHDSINIRGMGNSGAVVTGITNGVDILRDGLLMQETIGQDVPLYDIADTEVLEGPQGTFVGASSDGGTVEINSVNPSFTGLNGYVLGGIGSDELAKVQGAVNLPVTDRFAARLAFNDSHQNSFYKDEGAQLAPGASEPLIDPGHSYNTDARLSLLWQVTDDFQALGKLEYAFHDTGGDPGEPDPYPYNSLFAAGADNPITGLNVGCTLIPGSRQESCPGAGLVTHSPYYYPGETPFVLDYYNTNVVYNDLETRYSLELRETLPNGIALRSLSGMLHVNLKHIESTGYGPGNAGEFIAPVGPNNNSYSEEVNIISPTSGRLNWIVGGFWDYTSLPLDLSTTAVPAPYTAGALPTTAVYIADTANTRVAAVFGQLGWRFTDTLQLQVGARENWDNNFTVNQGSPAPAVGTVVPSPEGTGVYTITYPTGSNRPGSYRVISSTNSTGNYTDNVPTGKADLTWTPTAGQNFYAFYARGYKAGGVNAGSTDYSNFQPEHVNDYEIGWKGRLFDGHMLTQLGAYYMNYQNLQYQVFDVEENADTTAGNVVENLGASTIEGVEFSEQSRFGGLGVNLGFDYNHTKLGSIITLPAYQLPAGFNTPTAHPQCVAGHTYTTGVTCFNYTPYLQNITGEQMPFAPQITANVSIDYRFRVGGGTVDPRVQYTHTDHQYASIFQDSDFYYMGTRNLWNASVDWLSGKWDAQLYGTNLSNEIYVVAGGDPLYYGAPRQAGIQVTYSF